MNSMELVRHRSTGALPHTATQKPLAPRFSTELAAPVRSAILRARQFLIGDQSSDGVWLGHHSANASLASLLIFWLVYAGSEDSELAQQCAATILDQQLLAGGWSRLFGGPTDVSSSVQCYFALKLLGIDPSSERLSRARKRIRLLSGADASDATTRYILALFGQIDYDCCPPAPPEMLLFNDETRQSGPFSILWSHRPVRAVGIERGVRELFIEEPKKWREPQDIRRTMDRIEANPVSPNTPDRIEQFHFDEVIWHAIALEALGFARGSKELSACVTRLPALVHVDEDENTASPQLASTPQIDTAVVVRSLLASGMSQNHFAVSSGMAALRDGALLAESAAPAALAMRTFGSSAGGRNCGRRIFASARD